MRDDAGKSRYFAALSLFMFSMLGIVLANNFVMMFIFWELVGVSSYLLIGHWFERDTRGRCRQQGIPHQSHRRLRIHARHPDGLDCDRLGRLSRRSQRQHGDAHEPSRLSHRRGAARSSAARSGKSAQFPLHVWLPDAMEGPTPVSALIHAATMVAAGVYMLVRVGFLIQASPRSAVASSPGSAPSPPSSPRSSRRSRTTSSASSPTPPSRSSATWSWPSASPRAKRRCSTSSPTPSSRRCSSSAPARSSSCCITSRTSGRWAASPAELRITFLTFLIGTLALIGCPALQRLLQQGRDPRARLRKESRRSSALALFTAFLTAFYMMRLVLVVFLRQAAQRPGASTATKRRCVMTGPLIVLAVPASHRRLRIFREPFPATCRSEHEAGQLVPMLATRRDARSASTLAIPALSQSRRRPDRSRALPEPLLLRRDSTRWLIGATQDLLAQISRVSSIAGSSMPAPFAARAARRGASARSCVCSRSATCRPTHFSSASASSG